MRAVLEDHENADISRAERALFAFVQKLNETPHAIAAADVDALRAEGWSDEAIYDAVTVCALFNFYNRWIDGTGVRDMSPEAYAMSGKRIALEGYTKGK